ncbi:tubulin-like doman-containing protein, partial [Pseudoflavonifractor phocaeensis]|uniref:tubulin-like doman-containing protein n=1 Tax=Pseudoflavonifractor phocaeensis TaxID=1870988 RepID=UPI001959FD20
MTYDSLLLQYGGGIIPACQQSKQYGGAAAVAIGIGGTGVAALAELKRKVYQQLEPDNPGEPIPHYDHIQFLAIDSDETEIDGMRGKARLNKFSEFFSISNPHLRAALSGKDVIKANPTLNWMDIDRINSLRFPVGSGGVRQVGRYLLVSKAAALKVKIEEKCVAALRGLQSPILDIYIFAGTSGGTGSGCLLDTCYIVRKALVDLGWSSFGNIMGFFFLPDVVISKAGLAGAAPVVGYNFANSYATLKELDYHMDLRRVHDRFSQNYGSFAVDTQEPPVDMCHLISATDPDGTFLPDGFRYATHLAADAVMAYLTDVELDSAASGYDKGLTMFGHLVNVTCGIAGLPGGHDVNCVYHLLGAAAAEVPSTQMSTYLAAGFYQRFQGCVGRDKVVITKPIVDEWVQKLGLTTNQVYNELVRGCDTLFLPEIERKELAAYGPLPKGKAPQPWAAPGNDWIDRCFGKRAQNRAALNAPLVSFDFDKVPTGSLSGRIFRKLCELCMDPNYGPYYAAGLLSHQGYDLISALDGAIHQVKEEQAAHNLQLQDNYSEYMAQCSAEFCKSLFMTARRNYERYKDAVQQWYVIYNRCAECDDLLNTLHSLKNELSKLYQAFFAPLVQLLDNLKETFMEDLVYLDSQAAAPTAYTRRILELGDVRSRLEEAVAQLSPNEVVSKFVTHLLKGYDQWQIGDDGKIGQYISRYMEEVFQPQINRSLDDYLMDVYPQ